MSDVKIGILASSDAYEFEIAGECYRQDSLTEIVLDAEDDGIEIPVLRLAAILHDAGNSHDQFAMKVIIGGEHIGFIPRHHAHDFYKALARANETGGAQALAAMAQISDDGLDGYQVRLNIAVPIRVTEILED